MLKVFVGAFNLKKKYHVNMQNRGIGFVYWIQIFICKSRTKCEQCFSGHLLVYPTTSFFKKQWKPILSWTAHKWKKKRKWKYHKKPTWNMRYEAKITTIPSHLENRRWIEGVILSWNDVPMTDIQIVVFQKRLWKLVFFFSTHKNVHNSKAVMYIIHNNILYIIWLFIETFDSTLLHVINTKNYNYTGIR